MALSKRVQLPMETPENLRELQPRRQRGIIQRHTKYDKHIYQHFVSGTGKTSLFGPIISGAKPWFA
jgi:hypothetical protein